MWSSPERRRARRSCGTCTSRPITSAFWRTRSSPGSRFLQRSTEREYWLTCRRRAIRYGGTLTQFSGREARLKPEFSHLYPPLEAGQWGPAGVMADRMVGWLLRQPNRGGYVSPHRVLRPEHFDFRGGQTGGVPGGKKPSRREDRGHSQSGSVTQAL